MASWRCPHCGSPQLEAARCWVCRRSTTSCASCRHFRKAVAVRLGYCALDKHRAPLTGEEERSCWERSSADAPDASDAAFDEEAESAAADVRGLWGVPAQNEEPPDKEARARGLWTEPDSAVEPHGPSNKHGRSIRSRPWGPVPGLPEPTGWRRGVRLVSGRG